MPIEDVFSIKGRGTVATGRVDRGMVKVGDEVEIVGLHHEPAKSLLPAWKCSTNCWTTPNPAMPSGCCCAALSAKISSAARFWPRPVPSNRIPMPKAEVYVLTKEEGGRHTPFFNGYKPQFYIRTTDVTGNIELPAGRRNGYAWR